MFSTESFLLFVGKYFKINKKLLGSDTKPITEGSLFRSFRVQLQVKRKKENVVIHYKQPTKKWPRYG